MKSRLVVVGLLAIAISIPQSSSAVSVKKERATAIIENFGR